MTPFSRLPDTTPALRLTAGLKASSGKSISARAYFPKCRDPSGGMAVNQVLFVLENGKPETLNSPPIRGLR
jgi:hypothetical protein